MAFGVVLYHSGSLFGYTAINGLVAVHIFFIISGFYMALIIKNKYAKAKRPYYTFITNRFLRIYPTYLVVLALMIFVQYAQFNNLNFISILTGIFSTLNHYLSLRKPLGIIEDFSLLIRNDYLNINMFRYDPLTIVPAWSLVLELFFYLTAPFLLFVKKRYLFFLAIISLSMHVFIDHYFNFQSFFIPSNFFFFLMGIFSYYLYEKIKQRKIKIKYSFALSLLFLITIFLWNYIPAVSFRLIVIKEWLMYLLTPFAIPLLFESFNFFPLNNFMANLSYAIYISHMLSINFLQNSIHYKITEKFFSFWAVLVTLIISITLVYLIEKPIDRLRQKRVKE